MYIRPCLIFIRKLRPKRIRKIDSSRTTTPQQPPRRHSISTVTGGKASPSSDNNNVASADVKFEELAAAAGELSRKKKVEMVDAESNTVATGEIFFPV
jgi:hypothetical protein